jgi:hypothetical protein
MRTVTTKHLVSRLTDRRLSAAQCVRDTVARRSTRGVGSRLARRLAELRAGA